jgi:HTH-type transcriptional regulator/antitoxin HigA
LATNVKIDKYVLFAWQALCELTTNTEYVNSELNLEMLKSKMNDMKDLMFDKLGEGCRKLQELLALCGIAFNVVKHFRGAPVQGFIKQAENGKLILCLTIRGGRADTFWFTLFHEIAHILNKDYEAKFVDFDSSDNEKELKADKWARDFLLPPEIYREIISLHRKPTWMEITTLADKAGVQPYIVLGRLQKDGVLEWSDYANQVQRYKWIE